MLSGPSTFRVSSQVKLKVHMVDFISCGGVGGGGGGYCGQFCVCPKADK